MLLVQSSSSKFGFQHLPVMALDNRRAKVAYFTRSEHTACVLWSVNTLLRNSSSTWPADRTLRSVPCVSQRVLACNFCCNWDLCATSTWPTPTVCSHATVAASVREVYLKKSKQFHVSCKQAIWDTSRNVLTYDYDACILDAARNVEWRQEKTQRLL
jgi:hypothetical protein